MPTTHAPWFDLTAYGLSLVLMRAQGGRSWLLAHGDVDANAQALSAMGLRAHPQTHGSWFRAFANGESLRSADVLQAFPRATTVSLLRSRFIVDAPPPAATATPASTAPIARPDPRDSGSPAALQRSEFGRTLGRLLSQAGVVIDGRATETRVFGEVEHSALRIQRWAEDRVTLVRVESLGEARRVEASLLAALDGSGQWHLRNGSVWSSQRGYRDGPDPLVAITLVRALVESGVANGSPVLVDAHQAVESAEAEGIVGRLIRAEASGGAPAAGWVTGMYAAAGRLWMDVSIEDEMGRSRLRFAGAERDRDRSIELQIMELLEAGERLLPGGAWEPRATAPQVAKPAARTPSWIKETDHVEQPLRAPVTRVDTPRDAARVVPDAGYGSVDAEERGRPASGEAGLAGGSDESVLRDAAAVEPPQSGAAVGGASSDPRAADGGGAGARAKQWAPLEGRDAGRRRRVDGASRSGRADYRLSDAPDEGSFNAVRAIESNISALRALGRIEGLGPAEAPEEGDLKVLAGYIGWGGLPQVFARGDRYHVNYYPALQELLTEQELSEARASTLNAHYTSYSVVDSVWAVLQHLGVAGGVGLEPGAGTGRFLARRPQSLADDVQFVAVEKDGVSARILKALHPYAQVHAAGFEATAIADGSIDFVVGNVPFGAYQVYDPRYKTLRAPIHDYFIVKSLDKLAPGGVMAVITSTGTLDKQSSNAREAMYASADLLGAFRLPNTTFRDNANTTVTTDLLVFRKRLPDDVAQPFDWRSLTRVRGADGSDASVNGVFDPKTKRGVFMGWLITETAQYGRPRVAVTERHPTTRETAPPVVEWADVFRKMLPAGVHAPIDSPVEQLLISPEESAARSVREGRYTVINDRVCCVYDGVDVPLPGLSRIDDSRLRLFIPVRDALRAIIDEQLVGCADDVLNALQGVLGSAYDAFVKAHGPVSLPANRRPWINDPDAVLVLASEIYDAETKTAKRASVFSERTLGRRSGAIQCDSPRDALAMCINELGRVDPARIEALARRPWSECREALRGEVYFDPDGGRWDIAARYLAGHIPRKLALARAAAADDAELEENVEALTARLPRRVSADEIDVSLGSPWVPVEVINVFVVHFSSVSNVNVLHNPHLAQWSVEAGKRGAPLRWGTQRMDAWRLLELALNGQAPQVFDSVSTALGETRVLNVEQTAMAIEKQKQLQQEFADWVFSDPARRTDLEDRYNYLYNGFRSPDYSSLRLRVPGLALGMSYRDHQLTGIARGVLEPNELLAHPVGFGKTATMAGIVMLGRSIGIINKAAIVTPKNVIYDFAAEIVRFFPNARVLTIRPEDLSPKGRTLFWRRTQVSNPDVILVTPEAFKRLRLPAEAEAAYMQEEISRIEMALSWEDEVSSKVSAKSATKKVKRMEALKRGMDSRLQRLLNTDEKDDNRISLKDLGVDAILVDEAHRYKNLQVNTRQRVLGVPTAASQRASDMHSKVRYIQQLGGRVVFATGSAITNTLAEAYNLQRYLMPEEMDAQGVGAFDAWKAQYGHVINSLEPDPGGQGYRTVARLAEVRNVPELVAMLGQVTDAVADRADKVGGRPDPVFKTLSVEATGLQSLYRDVLSERVVYMRANPTLAKDAGENVLVVLGDARRASLDLRAQFPRGAPADSGGKLSKVAETVLEVYRRSADVLGTQAVFLDFSTPPASAKADRGWNGYEELTQKLVAGGMKRQEIAWIHDAKTDPAKADLFRRVRSGEKRVILGSTEKMGEGTNMQERIVALHHLNAPHHPGHIVQRNGRGVRFGNINATVEIYTYVTKGLLEDWAWHLVTLKDGFIRQMFEGLAAHRDGEGLARRIVEDGAAMSFAEIEAHASDNPLVKSKAVADERVQRLELLERADGQDRGAARSELKGLVTTLEYNTRTVQASEAYTQGLAVFEQAEGPALLKEARKNASERAKRIHAQERAAAGTDSSAMAAADAGLKKRLTLVGEEDFCMRVGTDAHLGRVSAGKALIAAVEDIQRTRFGGRRVVAHFAAAEVVAEPHAVLPKVELVFQGRALHQSTEASKDPVGMIRRVEKLSLDALSAGVRLADRLATQKQRKADAEQRIAQPWPRSAELAEARAEQRGINIQLAAMNEGAPERAYGFAAHIFEQAFVDAGGVLAGSVLRTKNSPVVFDEFDFASFKLKEEDEDQDEKPTATESEECIEDAAACHTIEDGAHVSSRPRLSSSASA